MKENHTIFLNFTETLRAIRSDLKQYRPQPLLLRHIAQLILGEKILVSEDKSRTGLWVGTDKKCKYRMIPYDRLPDYLCSLMERTPPPVEMLAKICGCVFQERAYAGYRNCEGEEGIFIETGMDDFSCLQCGRCCRLLDYHKELTHEDYLLWKSLGRTDIMERVGLIRKSGEIVAYVIWIDPVTRQVSEKCPWLKKDSENNRYLCRIYEVRPEICRQYPGTGKHGQMTGCSAFKPRSMKTRQKTA